MLGAGPRLLAASRNTVSTNTRPMMFCTDSWVAQAWPAPSSQHPAASTHLEHLLDGLQHHAALGAQLLYFLRGLEQPRGEGEAGWPAQLALPVCELSAADARR